MSERDGWNHLYLYRRADRGGQEPDHQGATGSSAASTASTRRSGQIWFRAGGSVPGQDPYHVHYARVNFDGTGLVLLTEGDGNHAVQLLARPASSSIDTYSRVDLPPVTELRRAEDGKLVCELERAD